MSLRRFTAGGVIADPIGSSFSERENVNDNQRTALRNLCERYRVEFSESDYVVNSPDSWTLPGYAEGWIGGYAVQTTHPTLYVGCAPDGRISS